MVYAVANQYILEGGRARLAQTLNVATTQYVRDFGAACVDRGDQLESGTLVAPTGGGTHGMGKLGAPLDAPLPEWGVYLQR